MINSQESKIQIVELNYDSHELESFFEIYRNIFHLSGKDNIEKIKKYLLYKTTGFYGHDNYHIIIAKETDIVGFIIGYYYHSSSFGIIESIGVDEGTRGKSISRILLTEFEILAKNDAINSTNLLNGLMVEVEDPQKTESSNNSLPFWDHCSYKLVCINYSKPSNLDAKLHAQNDLLLIKNLDGRSYIDVRIFLSLLKDHFIYATGNNNPEELEEFIKIRDQVSSYPYITLRKVGPALFKGVSVHYIITLDMGMFTKNLSKFEECLFPDMDSKEKELIAIKYGSSIQPDKEIEKKTKPLIFARYIQNKLNFSFAMDSREFPLIFISLLSTISIINSGKTEPSNLRIISSPRTPIES